MFAGDGEHVLDLLDGIGHIGVRQINFVDDRNDLKPLPVGEVHIGNRLRFDALRGIDDEQRAFARAEAAGNFVGKIHVPRRVDEVQLVLVPVLGGVHHRHRMRLDGDAAFALEVHRVEQLIFHLAIAHRVGGRKQPIRQRGFPVVDVGNDAKISYVFWIHP